MTEILYCANHPNVETLLRCNRCERPICTKCAVKTPTGYRCKECVRTQQKAFENAAWYDYLIGFGVTTILSLIVSSIIAAISFVAGFFMWFIAIAVAAGAGILIARIVLPVLRRRRSRALFLVTAAGVVAGALPAVLFLLFSGNLFSLIWQGIYVFTAAPTVFYRISGIQLR